MKLVVAVAIIVVAKKKKIGSIATKMAQAQIDLKRKRDSSRKKPTQQKKRMLEEALREMSTPKQPQQQSLPQQEVVVAVPTMMTPPPTILTDDDRVADPDISKAVLEFDDYVQQVHVLEESFRADDNIRTQPDYHLPKIPTTKEWVLGILNNPTRQVKKAIDRREIFMIAYICTKDLNQRTVLEMLQLSARTMRLVQLQWLILPQSFIHHEDTITKFSPRGSMCQKKYSIIKEYFDVSENLSTLYRNVQVNLDLTC